MSPEPTSTPSVLRGRLCILLAALLWSLSGLFTRLLQHETVLGLHSPELTPLQIAFFRSLFAGLFFLPMLRRADITFRPLMPVMVVIFAVMNATFISAMALGTAANAIWLQYTAPLWLYLAAIFVLGEPAERRATIGLIVGMAGVVVILAGGWRTGPGDQFPVILMALASGITYAAVLLCLRLLRTASASWLTTLNHLGAAAVLAFFVWSLPLPTVAQVAFLVVFGVVQMGLPYWLTAKGLRSVSPQEAGLILLLEPLLNPVWAYLLVPARETPSLETWIGAGLILGALVWRYAPRGPRVRSVHMSGNGSEISRT